MNENTARMPRLRFLHIIWFQQLVSLLIFGIVGLFIHQGQDPVTHQLVPYGTICLIAACTSIAFGLYLRHRYADTIALPLLLPANPADWKTDLRPEQILQVEAEANNVYKTVTIAGTAFAEVAAILGLVFALHVHMPILYMPFGGLAGVFILWQLPNMGSFDAICGALVRRKQQEVAGG